MITSGNPDKRAEIIDPSKGVRFVFTGMSFDKIPTGTFDGQVIANNSAFYAQDIDQRFYYHDGQWTPVGHLPLNLSDEEYVRLFKWWYHVYPDNVYVGFSTDDKPETVEEGDCWFEKDSYDAYQYTNGSWVKLTMPYMYDVYKRDPEMDE